MQVKNNQSILIVDDISSIRDAIAEFLECNYRTFVAADGFDALGILEQHEIDLLITDIRMPGMGGLQLCNLVRKKYPHVQLVLMTAYNADEYIRFVRDADIWNLIPKTTMNLHYIKVMVDKLLTRNIFGIQQYFPNTKIESIGLADLHRIHRHKWPARIENTFFKITIQNTVENNTICDMVGDILLENESPSFVRMILEELTANAIIHAPLIRQKFRDSVLNNETNNQSECDLELIELEEQDAFELGFGIVEKNVVISITDMHGTFDKSAALTCLERQTTLDPKNGLPIGLVDYHGRGLYISREKLDQLIFNIEPEKCTEIISILDLEASVRTRAISIFEGQ